MDEIHECARIKTLETGENPEQISKKINFRNTMTDEHVVAAKMVDLLESTWREALPEVVDNWEELSEEKKKEMETLNRFHCGLHALVNTASSAEETIWEKDNNVTTTNWWVIGSITCHFRSCVAVRHVRCQQTQCLLCNARRSACIAIFSSGTVSCPATGALQKQQDLLT